MEYLCKYSLNQYFILCEKDACNIICISCYISEKSENKMLNYVKLLCKMKIIYTFAV